MNQLKKNAYDPRVVNWLSNFGYLIGCGALFIIALWIIATALVSVFKDGLSDQFSVYNLLDEVALIVFSIAVIDVSKYLIIEEVFGANQKKEPKEIRRALTKFVVIIATALSLEGLVLTIETAKSDISQLYYPAVLLFMAVFFIIGLGIYQKLNASAEK